MSAIVIQNKIVHYEVLGRGRPIVLLHSWVGSWRDWMLTMQAASSSYRSYAIDLWGYGDSGRHSPSYSIRSQSDLVAAFLDSLGIAKIALVGHGLGALVAIRLAQTRPQHVDRLLLVGLPVNRDSVSQRLERSSPEEISSWLLDGVPGSEALQLEARKADPLAIRQGLKNLESFEALKRLAEIEQPCLLVYNRDDPVVRYPDPVQVAGSLKFTHHILLEGSGHHPMIREAGRFSRLVADFLSLGADESPAVLKLKDEWKRRFR